MQIRHRVALVVSSAVLALVAVPTQASDPVGVYAVIEKVVLEPSEAQPQRIQIWGAFALADRSNNDDYGSPKTGYLFYTCPTGQDSICRSEWADLKSVAGKGEGVGFGGRFLSAGRVRAAADKPSAPDTYPIRMGVVRMGAARGQMPGIVASLKKALQPR
jgi:hypothetical protein